MEIEMKHFNTHAKTTIIIHESGTPSAAGQNIPPSRMYQNKRTSAVTFSVSVDEAHCFLRPLGQMLMILLSVQVATKTMTLVISTLNTFSTDMFVEDMSLAALSRWYLYWRHYFYKRRLARQSCLTLRCLAPGIQRLPDGIIAVLYPSLPHRISSAGNR